MALVWGVSSYLQPPIDRNYMADTAAAAAVECGLVRGGDNVLVVAASPAATSSVNSLTIVTIDDCGLP